MPPTHQGLGSPLSPIPSRPESFGPLSQYHNPPSVPTKTNQKPAPSEPTVSPLDSGWPDSPTLGYLSPVSIMSPKLSVPSELLYHERTPGVSQRITGTEGEEQQRATTGHHLARGGTLHLQDHVPFKPAAVPTRFPARKPVLAAQSTAARVAADDEVEASRRPITMYLADHHPYLMAPSPEAVIARPAYSNRPSRREGRLEVANQAASQDIEMQEIALREPSARPVVGEDEEGTGDAEGKRKTEEDVKRRKRNCVICSVFILTLLFAIVVFAVFVFEVNKPTGAAR